MEQMAWHVESSPFGRVVVPAALPTGRGLFYTTEDFDGRLDEGAVAGLTQYIDDRFGFVTALSTCHQVHGTKAVRIDGSEGPEERKGCDALVTDSRGTALGIKVADCLPITLFQGKLTANIHSGWRGTAGRIVASAFRELRSWDSFAPGEATVFLGPSIRSCCFEVGEEVVAQFAAAFGDISPHLDRSRGTRPFLDNVGITSDALAAEGVLPERIFDSGLCTRCDGSIFHSYRRSGANAGRNLAVAAQ